MDQKSYKGISIVELTVAVAVTAVVGMSVFHLFKQNESVFRDQNTRLEAQQNLRAVAFQITDEIRMAGQGVPVYSGTFDSTAHEAIAVVLEGSDASRLYIRAGVSAVEGEVNLAVVNFTPGTMTALPVSNALGFSQALGTMPEAGRFVYVWGSCANGGWGWVRAEVISISTALSRISVIPRQTGDACRLEGGMSASHGAVQFTSPSTISLEEVISLYFDAGSIKRATATNVSIPDSPVWGPAAELAQNVSTMKFRYYTEAGVEIIFPRRAMAGRSSISRIDVQIAIETATALSTGDRKRFDVALTSIPRSLRIR